MNENIFFNFFVSKESTGFKVHLHIHKFDEVKNCNEFPFTSKIFFSLCRLLSDAKENWGLYLLNFNLYRV